MKRLGDWEYAHGINFMNQHLSFSTLVGSRKYDWPQSFGEHDPWWGQYHVLANYFARLSLALAAGETRNDTLILEPTTSAWMYAARPASNPRLDEIGNTFQQFINALESRQIEYDLGSEQILRHFGAADGARLRIRERAYSRLVLPPGLETLDASTVALLEKFLSAGGTVLSFVDVPRLVDGAPSDRVTALGVKYAARWKRLGAPDELTTAGVAFLPLDHAPGGNLFHLRRKLDSGEILFLVNTSLDAPASAVLTANGASVQKLDAFTGKLQPYPWKRVAVRATTQPRLAPARIQAAFDIPPAGSLLLLVSSTPVAPSPPAPAALAETSVAPEGPLAVRRLSPNILRLDYLDLTLAGKEEKGIYFYTAADEIFKNYGFDGNPWLGAVQFKTELLDKDHFPPESGFSAAFHFRIAPGVPLAGLQAVVERPWLWKVLLNGVEVNSPEGAAWIDPDFGRYPIAAAARAGDNVLTLVAQPFSVHHELEPVYILGDFGVQAEPAGFSIVPATTLALGDWKSQQMPFYSDRVAYTRHYTLAAAQAALVRMDKWWGSTAEIRVNGQSVGVMVNPPWEADITPFLHDGDNSVDVVVYGSLKNVFGPHLGKITRGFTSPWSHRYPPTPRQQPPGSAYDLDGYGLQTDFTVVSRK